MTEADVKRIHALAERASSLVGAVLDYWDDDSFDPDELQQWLHETMNVIGDIKDTTMPRFCTCGHRSIDHKPVSRRHRVYWPCSLCSCQKYLWNQQEPKQ